MPSVRLDLMQMIFPPIVACLLLVLVVYAVCMRRRQLCSQCNMSPREIIPAPPTVSASVFLRPSLTRGQVVLPIHPPTYAECVVEESLRSTVGNFANVCDVPPAYDDIFGHATPSYAGEFILDIVSLGNDAVPVADISTISDATSSTHSAVTLETQGEDNVTSDISFTVTVEQESPPRLAYVTTHSTPRYTQDVAMVTVTTGGHYNMAFVSDDL